MRLEKNDSKVSYKILCFYRQCYLMYMALDLTFIKSGSSFLVVCDIHVTFMCEKRFIVARYGYCFLKHHLVFNKPIII